jgi:hypothetical protein
VERPAAVIRVLSLWSSCGRRASSVGAAWVPESGTAQSLAAAATRLEHGACDPRRRSGAGDAAGSPHQVTRDGVRVPAADAGSRAKSASASRFLDRSPAPLRGVSVCNGHTRAVARRARTAHAEALRAVHAGTLSPGAPLALPCRAPLAPYGTPHQEPRHARLRVAARANALQKNASEGGVRATWSGARPRDEINCPSSSTGRRTSVASERAA